MRSLIMLLVFIIASIISLPLYLVALIIRAINQKKAASFSQSIIRVVFKLALLISGAKATIRGLENIPKDTPVMFASNHRSFWDIVIAYSIVPINTAFVSKKSIKYYPTIGQWMYFLNCKFLDRGDLRQNMKVILETIDLAKNGYSIFICPEGTRNPKDTLLPFKDGSMKISTKSKCPIVPVCIKGTEKIFEDSLPFIKSGKISIEFSKPIYPETLEGDDKKHIGKYVQNIVQNMYDKEI